MHNRSPLRLAAFAAAALALSTWAVPAEAHGGRKYRSHHRHEAHDDDREHRSRYVGRRRGVPVYRHDSRRARSYYCAPCQHRFDSRSGFRRHLSHRHHIAPWRIPFVVVHGVVRGVFAWVFYG